MQHDSHGTEVTDFAMHFRQAAQVLALLLAMPSAHAAGLGGYEVQSALGQPLRMVVQITARADETIDAGCFKINSSTVANDGLPQLTGAQLTLDRRNNQQRLIVTSARPVLDPIVRVSIDVGCDATLRRDLTLLLDPLPVIETQAEAAEPARPAGGPVAPAGRPATTAAAGEAARSAPASGAGAATGSTGAAAEAGSTTTAAPASPRASRQEGAASASKGAAKARPPRALKAADPQAPGQPRPRPPKTAAQQPHDRLSISTSGPPLESYVGAPITPRLTLSTTLADRSARPPLPDTVLSILRQKQARLKAAPTEEDIPSLEAELVVLQKRTAEMRSQLDVAMAQLQSLREAAGTKGTGSAPAAQPATVESAAAATPVSALPAAAPASRWDWRDPRLLAAVALGLVILLLIVGFAVWLRRERSDSRRAARWNKTPYVPVTAPPPTPTPRMSFGTDRDSERMERVAAPSDRPPLPESYAFSPFSTGNPAGDLGVSDLAQATEKASVFVTLGRPEQAIDVLRDHIDHEPKPSPMGWLMLLDLYRKNGRRSEFADVSQRFHLEFNVAVPAWDQTSPQDDAGMAAFPHLIHKIRDDWGKPESRAYIEELLYDNRGGLRIGFNLPAFRDLLLLHSIIDGYLTALEAPAKTDLQTGAAMPPPPPAPPPHLAKVWAMTTAKAPEFPAQPPLQLDMGLLSPSPERSELEAGYPIIAEAIMTRWGKPGVAEYLGNLIRATNDNRGPSLSSETMAELIMLHDVALELDEPQPGYSLP